MPCMDVLIPYRGRWQLQKFFCILVLFMLVILCVMSSAYHKHLSKWSNAVAKTVGQVADPVKKVDKKVQTRSAAQTYQEYQKISSEIPICTNNGRAVLIYDDNVPFSKMDFTYDVHPMRMPKLYIFKSGKPVFKSGKPVKVSNYCIPLNKSAMGRWTALTKQYKSCAIIGSSGILYNSGCGKEIDSHDFIMRSNMAPFDSRYSKDVGSRADLMAVNYECLRMYVNDTDHKNQSDHVTHFTRTLKNLNGSILWFPKDTRREDIATKMKTVGQIAFAMGVSLRLAYSWKEKIPVEKTWKIKPASLGFIAFDAARTFCSSISLYGFYPFQVDSDGSRVFHHYYDEKFYNFSTPMHDMSLEHAVLKKLHDQKKIRMVTNKCDGRT